MGRMALVVALAGLAIVAAHNGVPELEGLEGKFWLVAIFPAVYMLGIGLLRD